MFHMYKILESQLNDRGADHIELQRVEDWQEKIIYLSLRKENSSFQTKRRKYLILFFSAENFSLQLVYLYFVDKYEKTTEKMKL